MLLIVSFGTSVAETSSCITRVEETLRAQCPHYIARRAFTSPTIRRILERRGEHVDSLEQALARACAEGFTHVLVQPTHLLCGFEYDKICRSVQQYRERFVQLKLGEPLLASEADLAQLADILSALYPSQMGEALVLMGHGTAHPANILYHQLQKRFRAMGRDDVWVGTVEGDLGIDEIACALNGQDFRKAHLVPLLLVAGEHARHDMAGDNENSWKRQLETQGIQVRCTLEGLGMCEAVREMYGRKLRTL